MRLAAHGANRCAHAFALIMLSMTCWRGKEKGKTRPWNWREKKVIEREDEGEGDEDEDGRDRLGCVDEERKGRIVSTAVITK